MTKNQRIAAWTLGAIALVVVFLAMRQAGGNVVMQNAGITPGPGGVTIPALSPIAIMRNQLPEFTRPEFKVQVANLGNSNVNDKSDCGCKPTCGCSKSGNYLLRPPTGIGKILENMIASLPAQRDCLFPRTDWEAFYNAPANADLRMAFSYLTPEDANWINRQGYALTPGEYAKFMAETDPGFQRDINAGNRPRPETFTTC